MKLSRSMARIPIFTAGISWNAIHSGNYPEWEMGLQLFDEDFANSFAFDVDATKLRPEEEVPIVRVAGTRNSATHSR